MGTELKVVMKVGKVEIVADQNAMTSLTDLWRAAGSDPSKKPAEWLRSKAAVDFIASLASNLKVGIPTLTKVRKGKHLAGTWAHWQAGMAYAEWINPTFHQVVNAGFLRWLEEERNPSLKLERGVKKLLSKGFTREWINTRLEGIVTRKELTDTMADHGCKQAGKLNPYVEATRSVTLAAIGQTPKEFRADKGLVKKSQLTRDAMTSRELMRIAFAESEAKAMIQETAADGNGECLSAVRTACKAVKAAIQVMSGRSLPAPDAA